VHHGLYSQSPGSTLTWAMDCSRSTFACSSSCCFFTLLVCPRPLGILLQNTTRTAHVFSLGRASRVAGENSTAQHRTEKHSTLPLVPAVPWWALGTDRVKGGEVSERGREERVVLQCPSASSFSPVQHKIQGNRGTGRYSVSNR